MDDFIEEGFGLFLQTQIKFTHFSPNVYTSGGNWELGTEEMKEG